MIILLTDGDVNNFVLVKFFALCKAINLDWWVYAIKSLDFENFVIL